MTADARNLRLTGDPIPIAADVGFQGHLANANISVSSDGVLAYMPGKLDDRRLTWLSKAAAVALERGVPARNLLPSPHAHVYVAGFQLQEAGLAPRALA